MVIHGTNKRAVDRSPHTPLTDTAGEGRRIAIRQPLVPRRRERERTLLMVSCCLLSRGTPDPMLSMIPTASSTAIPAEASGTFNPLR